MPSRFYTDTEEYRHSEPFCPERRDEAHEHFTDEGGPRKRKRGRLFVVVDGNNQVVSDPAPERQAYKDRDDLKNFYDTVHPLSVVPESEVKGKVA